MGFNQTVQRFISILIPTTILGFTIFWWNRKKSQSKSINQNIKLEVLEEIIEVVDVQSQQSIMKDIMHHDDSILEYKVEESQTFLDNLSQKEYIDMTDTFLNDFISPSKSKQTVILEEVIAVEDTPVESSNDIVPSGTSSDSDEIDVFPEMSNSSSILEKKKRYRNQSSCDGDSAIVEDYSSDSISLSESDSVARSPDNASLIDLMTKEIDKIKVNDDENMPWHSVPMPESAEINPDDFLDESYSSVLADEFSKFINSENVKDYKYSPSKSTRSGRSKSRSSKSKQLIKEPKKSSSPVKRSNSPSRRRSSPKKVRDTRERSRKSESGRREVERPWRGSEKEETVTDDYPAVIDYEFPDSKCGKLIGRSGKNVQDIKQKTGAIICIEAEIFKENRILSISGLKSQVRKAEKILLDKFETDLIKIKEVTREIAATYMSHVTLEESCDVIVTAVVDAGNFFVQEFKPEVDQLLVSLQTELENVYAFPRSKYFFSLEDPPKQNDICIGNIDNTWCRVKVKEIHSEENQAVLCFLDYGGDITVPIEILMKIRSDFLDIPCQAVECFLSNVVPLTNEEQYSYDATCLFGQIVEGKVLQSTIVSRRNKVPCLQMSFVETETQQIVSVNEEMTNWGVVRWV